ncbi:hypothetical protein [Clostridium formicaceticum]|nr:hypothetical protein [Clostridium formicaceticum]AOY77244.1 hypothetical protein BJL90_16135 [Clostridium formicaceticum]
MKIEKIDFIEKFLLYSTVILILMMVSFNYLTNYNRYYSVYYAQEEEKYNFFLSPKQEGFVVIGLVGQQTYHDLEVLVNGEVHKTFGEDTAVTIAVRDRDLVQVNATMYAEKITLRILEVSSNIKNSIPYKEITVNKNIEILSLIQI